MKNRKFNQLSCFVKWSYHDILTLILLKTILLWPFIKKKEAFKIQRHQRNHNQPHLLFLFDRFLPIFNYFPRFLLCFCSLKPRGVTLPTYEWHTLSFLCCGTEALFSPAWEILDNHPPSESGSIGSGSGSRPEAPASWVPPATASFPHSISIVTERDKWLGQG